jgi:predicted DNA-binding ArsR family transcriptional regulator
VLKMSEEEMTNIRNEVKSKLAESGYSLTYVVEQMNKNRDEEHKTTTQNISNKLSRGTIKYSEIKEIADIIGYKIKWVKEAE